MVDDRDLRRLEQRREAARKLTSGVYRFRAGRPETVPGSESVPASPAAELMPAQVLDEKQLAELAELTAIQESFKLLQTGSPHRAEAVSVEPDKEERTATSQHKYLEELRPLVLEQFSRQADAVYFDKLPLSGRRSHAINLLGPLFAGHLEAARVAVPRAVLTEFIARMADEISGFGPLQPLIDDPDVTEIMVNGTDQVYIERRGRLEPAPVRFRDEAQVMAVAQKIVSLMGRRLDMSNPHVDARLPDGSRVHCIIPPLALDGTTITIRKFSREQILIEELINWGTLSAAMAFFLGACIKARLNILVSGGTGSGKTTTLNMLASLIPAEERIITVEDAAELKVRDNHEHVVRLETRAPNIEGRGQVTIRDLLRDCLRMRPDRIVVGEVRGGEAFDMLQAMNTGHEGSLSTLHANSPEEAVSRLETMCLMAGLEMTGQAIRQQIGSSIDLLIQQKRYPDGSRRISRIAEVLLTKAGEVEIHDIFAYDQRGLDDRGSVLGRFRFTGHLPAFIQKFEQYGIPFPKEFLVSDPE